jgi:putative phage-type endonuclease
MITDSEEEELIENAGMLIHELIMGDPMCYIHPNFHEYVISEVSDIMGKQLDEVFFGAITVGNNTLYDDFTHIVESAMKLFYKYISPKRSYDTSFIRISPDIEKMKTKIKYLKDIPQPEQRTTEWYNFRYKYLTASNIWKAFISESTRNQLIYEKCKPLNVEKYNIVSTDTPMHWGVKYEPLSIMFYERIYKTKISDFGCIPHKSLSFLAASPDGINTLETSERFGRMVEVKNIVNREIDGNPKMEYWIQMQVQMEVCDLNECDFLETRFIEYDSFADFESDGSYSLTLDGKKKGVIIMYFTKDKQPHYEYAPLGLSKSAFEKWEEENIRLNETTLEMTWIKNIYWKLDELSCVLVLRNKLWFSYAVPILENVWSTIEKERNNGYIHRAPNKRLKITKSNSDFNGNINKCYINIDSLENDTETLANNDNEPLENDTEPLENNILCDDSSTNKNISIKTITISTTNNNNNLFNYFSKAN